MISANRCISSALFVVAIYAISAACHNMPCPSVPEPIGICTLGESSGAGYVTWKQCITLGHSDPGGNGTKLLGLGLEVVVSSKKYFMGVQCVDPTGIVDKNGNKISKVMVINHEMTGSLDDGTRISGEAWEGATLKGQLSCLQPDQRYPVTLRITSVSPTDYKAAEMGGGAAPPFQLGLDVRRPDNNTYDDACVSPDIVYRQNAAFPVSGSWTSDGTYRDDGNVNFACRDHVVAKCLRANYPMRDNASAKADLFQACTRAMRADYCGAGVPFTKDGTPIVIRDTMGVSSRDIPSLPFESAWTKDKMLCLGHQRMRIPSDPDSARRTLCVKEAPRCRSRSEAEALGSSQPLVFIYSSSRDL
jgi:hypothetical protein